MALQERFFFWFPANHIKFNEYVKINAEMKQSVSNKKPGRFS